MPQVVQQLAFFNPYSKEILPLKIGHLGPASLKIISGLKPYVKQVPLETTKLYGKVRWTALL